jgi:hypothetical protein
MAICNTLLQLGTFYVHLFDILVIMYSLSRFGMMHQEKYGNPVSNAQGPQPPSM